jgi:formylglycine-generating enzyme required for sulfatase activity
MRGALLALVLAAGCVPSGQIVLSVDTDAPVPPAPGTPFDPARPPTLFDQLRIDVIEGGAVVATRDFAVDAGRFAAGGVSIGIAPRVGDPTLAARVRLFRRALLVAGEPPASATIDTTVLLPSIGRSDHIQVSVVLHTDDVGQPIGAGALLPGPPGPSLVGTWPGAARVPCVGSAAADEVCVPGGAYLLGDPHGQLTLDGSPPPPPRLVVLSPFFLDRSEVTVAAFRQKWATLGGKYAPGHRDLSQDPTSPKTWCTWTDVPSGTEALPINCILRDTAQLYCQSRGRELPTEAQLEYVGSGLGAEHSYAWGDDEPTCADAIWGLGGGGGIDSADPGDSTCLPSAALGSLAPPGSGQRDRVSIGGGEVVDLAGNVAELALDGYTNLDEGVWASPGVVRDPVVMPASALDDTVARGGDFHNGIYPLRASYRQAVPHSIAAGVGFRCARAGAQQ